VLIDRMELRRILSVQRNEELNNRLRPGDLPDIDEAQILEFKRLDLVAKLNAVAGGMRLRENPTT